MAEMLFITDFSRLWKSWSYSSYMESIVFSTPFLVQQRILRSAHLILESESLN